jgi:hypothetical protein
VAHPWPFEHLLFRSSFLFLSSSPSLFFALGAIDKRNVYVFQVFRRRVVNGGVGAARRERRDEEASRHAGASQSDRLSFALFLAWLLWLEPDAGADVILVDEVDAGQCIILNLIR